MSGRLTPSSESEPGASSPELGSESRGSSVSLGLREEYEDLLRYAVVTPVLDGGGMLPAASSRKVVTSSSSQLPRHLSPLPGATRTGGVQPELSKVESESSVPSTPEPQEVPTPSKPPTLPSPSPPAPLPPSHPHIQTTPTFLVPVSHKPPPPMASGSRQIVDDVMGSHDRSHDSEETIREPVVDPEAVRLETKLDTWCLDLKRNIMAEFAQWRIREQERHHADLQRERQQHAYDLRQMQEELERYKELAVTYEHSIATKDHVIANLTSGLQKQKERVELQRSFSSWKVKHTDDRRETFCAQLALRHHHQKLKSRVWGAWFGIVQGKWKTRVERACQTKAEEVCVQLTEEYEERLAAVHRSLDESQQEIAKMKAEKELYEDNMKKAFMRGVCALNLEAMTMFHQHDPSPPPSNGHFHSDSEGDMHNGGHPPQPPPPSSLPPSSFPPPSLPPPIGAASASHVITQAQGSSYPSVSHPPSFPLPLPSRPLLSQPYPQKTVQLTLSSDPPNLPPPSLPTHAQGPRPQGRSRSMASVPPREPARGAKGRHLGGASGLTRKRGGGPAIVVERHVTTE